MTLAVNGSMATTVVFESTTVGAKKSSTRMVNRVVSGEPGVTRLLVEGVNTKPRKAVVAIAAVTVPLDTPYEYTPPPKSLNPPSEDNAPLVALSSVTVTRSACVASLSTSVMSVATNGLMKLRS